MLLPLGGHLKFFSLLAVSISIVFTLPLHAQPAPEKKIWDGVFTSNQALRGKSAFEGSCARCHNVALVGSERGPAIKGPAFLSHWDKGNLSDLFIKIRDTMPEGGPGTVSDELKIDILSYILQQNGLPSGSEELKVNLSSLEDIRIAKKGIWDGVFTIAQAGRGKDALLQEQRPSASMKSTIGSRSSLGLVYIIGHCDIAAAPGGFEIPTFWNSTAS